MEAHGHWVNGLKTPPILVESIVQRAGGVFLHLMHINCF